MIFAVEMLWLNLILFAFGLAILVKGSDWFVDAAASLARGFGVSELVIGLTLVSIGTSLPELASSVYAAFSGESTFIIGNIVGSNIANIALILGAGLVLGGSIGFSRVALRRDMPILLAVSLSLSLWFYFAPDLPAGVNGVGRLGGVLLLASCVGYTMLLCRNSAAATEEAVEAVLMSRRSAVGLIFLGLMMITAGSKLMVDTVVVTAQQWGVDPLVISLTVVAVGTSLPELAVTISGVLKKRHDIALGNIIGSNIYNILLIVGCCGMISPLRSTGSESLIALGVMMAAAAALWLFMASGKTLRRWQGWLLLAGYALFLAWTVIFCR